MNTALGRSLLRYTIQQTGLSVSTKLTSQKITSTQSMNHATVVNTLYDSGILEKTKEEHLEALCDLYTVLWYSNDQTELKQNPFIVPQKQYANLTRLGYTFTEHVAVLLK